VLPTPLDQLTDVERDVFLLYCQDMSLKQIAWQLGITPREVGLHKYCVMGKLGVKSNLRLAIWAYRAGLISDDPNPSVK